MQDKKNIGWQRFGPAAKIRVGIVGSSNISIIQVRFHRSMAFCFACAEVRQIDDKHIIPEQMRLETPYRLTCLLLLSLFKELHWP